MKQLLVWFGIWGPMIWVPSGWAGKDGWDPDWGFTDIADS
jgi:hypothetical protein